MKINNVHTNQLLLSKQWTRIDFKSISSGMDVVVFIDM